MALPVLQRELMEIGVELEAYRHALKDGELGRGFSCLNEAHNLMLAIANREDFRDLVVQFRTEFGAE